MPLCGLIIPFLLFSRQLATSQSPLLNSSARNLTPGQLRLKEKTQEERQKKEVEEMVQADLNILRE